jgi:hypothetical protein
MQGRLTPQHQQCTAHVTVAHSNILQVVGLQDGQSAQQAGSRHAMDIVRMSHL